MNRNLTIAQVVASFAVGGAERVVVDLAAGLSELGHRVLAVSLSPDPQGPLAAELLARGVPVHSVPKRSGIDVGLPLGVAALLRRERVDVVHVHNPTPLIYAALSGRMAGARVIYTKHGQGHLGSTGQKLLRKLASPLAHDFVTVSRVTAAQARAQVDCLVPWRAAVITNGIDLSRFAPDPEARQAIRRELGIAENAWVVGTVGRCDANKNHAGLVRAVAPLLGDGMHLIVAGDGPAMVALRREVARLPRPELVHLVGRRMDVPRLMAAFDVFALPSRSEGFPLVVVEAMATAVPVVSAAVGGVRTAVIPGKTGYLVRPDDELSLGDCLHFLAQNRGHARALGRAGRRLALVEYSAARMTREYLDRYQRALR